MQIHNVVKQHLTQAYPDIEWDTVGTYSVGYLNDSWYVGVPHELKGTMPLTLGNGETDWDLAPSKNIAHEITTIMLTN